ncbi:hypothetical protein FFA01_17960 [Frigoribacterium faeni]|uniref:Lipoprotein n=2 Tax=Frigoribacterium faeni TaxID=145483 RepID=A0ABQ0UPS4_9MICO|nr:hypothetical protein FFA01_17960 [Frigoribacterium faeni]
MTSRTRARRLWAALTAVASLATVSACGTDIVTEDVAATPPATWMTDSPEAESVSAAWVAGGGRDDDPLDLISLHVRRETVVAIVAANSLENSRQADALCNDLYAAALDADAAVHGAVVADEADIRLSYRDDAAGDDECLSARPREEDPEATGPP